MPRPRLGERPMTPAERVQRHRERKRRLEVYLERPAHDQLARYAAAWGCSRQELLRKAFLAVLPVMGRAQSAKDLYDRVRYALEAAGFNTG